MQFTTDVIIDSITDTTPPLSSTSRIPRVPGILTETHDYEKYFVPKVVSIGPYHFGTPKLEYVEKLKPIFTMKLLEGNKETLKSLYEKLGDQKMVQELRSFYAENSTTAFRDEVFTKMMLLDSCFILYYTQYILGEKPGDCRELKPDHLVFIFEDLFLLENQIPFKVLNEVMSMMGNCRFRTINPLIYHNMLASPYLKRSKYSIRKEGRCREKRDLELTGDNEPDHLLHLRHCTLTKHEEVLRDDLSYGQLTTIRNVKELIDTGIHFTPSDTWSLAHVSISGCPWWYPYVKIPAIIVDDSTKTMLLNLIAYEKCLCSTNDLWVTSFVCLLDSLIDDAEDVKVLRKAGVIVNNLGRDQDIAKLLNEIGTGLVPNPIAYLGAKVMIQKHYDCNVNTLLTQLKHELNMNPYAVFSSLGVITVILTGVQTYYTVWSPKGTCDDVCMFLKTNHHL